MFYSPLVAKSAGFENQNNGDWIAFLLAKVVLSRFFLPTSWIFLKQLFLSPSWPLSQQPIQPSASWAIALEPIQAQGIIVKHIAPRSDKRKFGYNVLYKLLRFPHSTIQITFTMHAENSLYFTKTVYSCYINVTASYQILGLKTLPVQLYIMHDDITLVS